MPRTPEELLNDIAELNALLLAKDAALAAKDAELVAAKTDSSTLSSPSRR
jgi:hypothetical protein